jgi:hypothetical protein
VCVCVCMQGWTPMHAAAAGDFAEGIELLFEKGGDPQAVDASVCACVRACVRACVCLCVRQGPRKRICGQTTTIDSIGP